MSEAPVKVVVNVPEALRRQVKAKAALAGMNVSDALRALLEAWVAGKIDLPAKGGQAQTLDK